MCIIMRRPVCVYVCVCVCVRMLDTAEKSLFNPIDLEE